MGSWLNVFADRMVDRRLFGYEIPAALSMGLNLTENGEKIALGWFVLNFFLLIYTTLGCVALGAALLLWLLAPLLTRRMHEPDAGGQIDRSTTTA